MRLLLFFGDVLPSRKTFLILHYGRIFSFFFSDIKHIFQSVNLCYLLLQLSIIDVNFIVHAYQSTLSKGASVQLVFGFEYAILLTIIANTLLKYLLHSIDLYR